VCCNNDFEQTLTLLHSEWSKEIEPSGQSSTHHPLVVSNPIDKKGSEFMRRNMRWEAPSMPTSAHDPGLLRDIHVYQYIFILVYLSIYGVTEDSKVYSLHARRKSNMIQMMVNLHHYIYLSIYLFISANRRNAHSANKLEHTHPCMPSTYSAQMLARTKLWLQRFVSVRASTLIYARVRCEMFFASLYVVLIQSLACSCEFVALYVTL